MADNRNTLTDEILVLAETLGDIKARFERVESEFAIQSRPLEAALAALSAAMTGIKTLQHHVLDNSLSALSLKVEEQRKAIDDQINVIVSELKGADAQNDEKIALQTAELKQQFAEICANVQQLSSQFDAQIKRVELEAKEQITKFAAVTGPQGPAGASFNPKGNWQEGVFYQRLDVVSLLGTSYVSNVDNNASKPTKNSDKWTVLAARAANVGGGGAGNFASLAGIAEVSQGGTGITQYAIGDILYANDTGSLARLPAGVNGQFLKTTGAGGAPEWETPTGGGDVVGPASATDNALVRFDGTSGTAVQNSNATLTDAGALTLASNLTVSGGTIGTATSTNLTLAGGSSGASLVLGQGTNGAATLTTSGTGVFNFQNAAPELRLVNSNTAVANGLYYYSGGSLDGSITVVPATAKMTFSIGRSVGWGGDMDFVIDTVSVGTVTPSGWSLAGNLTVSGGTITGGTSGLSLASGGTNQNITLTPSGTGSVSASGAGTSASTARGIFHAVNTSSQTYNAVFSGVSPNLTATQVTTIGVGVRADTNDSGYMGFRYADAGSTNNRVVFGFYGNDQLMSLAATGNVLIGTTTDSANGKLQLATHTTSAGGIGFGTGLSLFTSSTAGQLVLKDGSGTSPFLAFYDTSNNNRMAVGAIGTTSYVNSVAGPLQLWSSNTLALTLDSSQNATFAGNLTVSGVQNVIGSASPSANFPLRINQGATDATVTMDIANVSSGTSAAANIQLQTDAGTSFLRQHSAAHGVWPNYLLLGGSDKIAISTGSTSDGIELMTGFTTRVNITTATTTVSNTLAINNTVQTAAGVASTHKVTISIGGSTYYLLATNV